MKKCFVISPIGPDGSDTRKRADDLFDLIIQPALEIFDFEIVRSDKIFNTNAITEDIVTLIQNADLCIVDLTGQNPNVFYECGRRHETAKPFIHIKQKGEIIPFDLASIRTIDYDLSDARTTNDSKLLLRKFVNEFEESGYSSKSSGASLNSIATTLTRIERKLDSLSTAAPAVSQTTDTGGEVKQNPVRAFYSAYRNGNYPLAVAALRKFMKINHDVNLHLDMATIVTEAFEPSAAALVKEIIERNSEVLKPRTISSALHALYLFYSGAMSLKDEYEYLKGTTLKAMQRPMSDKDSAAFYNALANFEYGLANDLKALEYQKESTKLDPEEPAYHYNIAMIYEKLDMQEELLGSLNMLLAIYRKKNPKKEKINTRYLEYAHSIFSQKQMVDKVNQTEELLKAAGEYEEKALTIEDLYN